ncbi:GTP pyrophosphokinase [Variovorax sp. LT1R16]|uniref:GTP pyrophosphokinase n=1 Tax=Variovorax sp. LT1R16 TaxID=3443728 RepID=UPI003F454CA9
MNEQDILTRWEADKPLYRAWAKLIAREIEGRLVPAIAPAPLDYFLKVPMVPRLKGDTSLIDKALYRNKPYKNPYEEITDKLGMRYVVLLTSHITRFGSIIESPECEVFWSQTKDKDYEEERLAKPLEFSYQSVHYVLRSKAGLSIDGVDLPEGLACEVQIRTLLQHAHSELTHDTLYKPKTTAKPSVRRTVAKSMALIEATDEFFVRAMEDLTSASEPQWQLLDYLSQAYKRGTGIEPGQERSNQLVVDAFMELLPQDAAARINDLLTTKSYIFDRIKEQKGQRHFFNQPAVLLAYFLAETMPARTREHWPIESDDLAKVFADLGKKFN